VTLCASIVLYTVRLQEGSTQEQDLAILTARHNAITTCLNCLNNAGRTERGHACAPRAPRRFVMRSLPHTGVRDLVLGCVCNCMRGLRGSLLKAVHNEEIACRKTQKSLPLCVHSKNHGTEYFREFLPAEEIT
jgi:hypothetical protein